MSDCWIEGVQRESLLLSAAVIEHILCLLVSALVAMEHARQVLTLLSGAVMEDKPLVSVLLSAALEEHPEQVPSLLSVAVIEQLPVQHSDAFTGHTLRTFAVLGVVALVKVATLLPDAAKEHTELDFGHAQLFVSLIMNIERGCWSFSGLVMEHT